MRKLEQDKKAAGGKGGNLPLSVIMCRVRVDQEMKEELEGEDEDMEDEEVKDSIKE